MKIGAQQNPIAQTVGTGHPAFIVMATRSPMNTPMLLCI
jgi:hypothetical protein